MASKEVAKQVVKAATAATTAPSVAAATSSVPSSHNYDGAMVPLSQKQTIQSSGFWELLRRVLATAPERSNGVPLNPHFRYPAPGSQDPHSYDDPVTTPAGDIAGNPYWKRDVRRNYPIRSVVRQADLVSLLSLGSAAKPKQELIGATGEKALVEARKNAEAGGGVGRYLAEQNGANTTLAQDMFVDGMPPLPPGQRRVGDQWKVHVYAPVEHSSYPLHFPCRSFK